MNLVAEGHTKSCVHVCVCVCGVGQRGDNNADYPVCLQHGTIMADMWH